MIEELVSKLMIKYHENMEWMRMNSPHGGFHLFIKDSGDPSKYHEIVSLRYDDGKWSVVEDYLTTVWSYSNATEIEELNKNLVDLEDWLYEFIRSHEEYILGPKAILKPLF